MVLRSPIRMILGAVAVVATGCATPEPLRQVPLGQDDLDRFLAAGRDARNSGITIYADPAGARFEFANRPRSYRATTKAFISPARLRVPAIQAKTATSVDFTLLLDSSALQNWLLMSSVGAMDYRPFKPAMGEYPDHVVATVPGYAGVANKIILDKLHVESPVFYVPPATGNLGSLARAAERPAEESGEKAAQARRTLGARTHAVMGASLMRAFSFIRFDFPGRTVRFATDAAYQPAAASAVRANLPLRDWRGRPAVQGTLGGAPLLLVLDTAGDFDVSLPDATEAAGPLVLGTLDIEDVRIQAHADLDLPGDFPARLGLGVLARFAVTLDFKQRRVWFEGKALPAAESASHDSDDETPAPVHYKGITR
jgi:hypothetical protein